MTPTEIRALISKLADAYAEMGGTATGLEVARDLRALVAASRVRPE